MSILYVASRIIEQSLGGYAMTKSIVPFVTADVALAGTGILLASGPGSRTGAPITQVRLASVDSTLTAAPLSPAWCALDPAMCATSVGSLFGSSFTPRRPRRWPRR
jgi:hypothetical protein